MDTNPSCSRLQHWPCNCRLPLCGCPAARCSCVSRCRDPPSRSHLLQSTSPQSGPTGSPQGRQLCWHRAWCELHPCRGTNQSIPSKLSSQQFVALGIDGQICCLDQPAVHSVLSGGEFCLQALAADQQIVLARPMVQLQPYMLMRSNNGLHLCFLLDGHVVLQQHRLGVHYLFYQDLLSGDTCTRIKALLSTGTPCRHSRHGQVGRGQQQHGTPVDQM